jgi:hypothetical protein
VHRLDTGTSGVLVAARTPESWTALRAAFRRHDVVKRYVAIVTGVPAAGAVVDVPLAHDPGDRRRMRAARVGDRAWPASTRVVEVVAHDGRAAVTVEIRSGVTIGCGTPRVARPSHRDDALYGARSDRPAGRRLGCGDAEIPPAGCVAAPLPTRARLRGDPGHGVLRAALRVCITRGFAALPLAAARPWPSSTRAGFHSRCSAPPDLRRVVATFLRSAMK